MTIFEKKIHVKDILSEYLVFRDSVSDLFHQINKANKNQVVLDFSQVKSISRSFAQEYLQQRKQQSITMTEINMGSQVKKMFHSVKTAHKRSTMLSFDDTKEISIHDLLCHKDNQSAK
ncbi:hypothetical protein B6U98_04325 [Thermoplasmatales archaeon ex4572_165]|nr:MAG: hypothetical protein B6U98_04325 [Thermoplasmatales archaeon ex4572_165]